MNAVANPFGPAAIPLVLLPGTLCDARLFDPLLARLPPRRTHVGDMHGLESAAQLAERLLAAVPRRFALLGVSLGAIVALEVVARAPDRVAGVALVGGNAHAPAPDDVARRRAEIAAAGPIDGYIGETMWPRYVVRRRDEALRRALIGMARSCPPDALRTQTEVALTRADSRPRLASFAMPALVLAGAEDAINDAAVQRQMAAAMPWATLALVPNAGHFVLLEEPDASARAVADWLARVDALGRSLTRVSLKSSGEMS